MSTSFFFIDLLFHTATGAPELSDTMSTETRERFGAVRNRMTTANFFSSLLFLSEGYPAPFGSDFGLWFFSLSLCVSIVTHEREKRRETFFFFPF